MNTETTQRHAKMLFDVVVSNHLPVQVRNYEIALLIAAKLRERHPNETVTIQERTR